MNEIVTSLRLIIFFVVLVFAANGFMVRLLLALSLWIASQKLPADNLDGAWDDIGKTLLSCSAFGVLSFVCALGLVKDLLL